MIKMNAKELRENQKKKETNYPKNDVYIILEDVLDTYNIGSIFRLADATAAKKIYLCGGTEIPPNPRIKKSSINTTEIVEWEYQETTVDAIRELRKANSGIKVVAIEQNEKSVPYNEFEYSMPLVLIVGNESYGILPSTLKHVDAIVELPMFGINVSLNVMVSLGIILYKALEKVDA